MPRPTSSRVASVAPRAAHRPIALTVLALFAAASTDAWADDVAPEPLAAAEFDRSFLRSTGRRKVDLSRYAYGNPVEAGRYDASLKLNGTAAGVTEIRIARLDNGAHDRAAVCMTPALLSTFNVDMQRLPAEPLARLGEPGECIALEALVDGAHARFAPDTLSLDVTIPQAMARRIPREHIDVSQWKDGVTASYVGYAFNAYRNQSHGVADVSTFTSVNAGLNLGQWHFRHNGSLSTREHGPTRYQNVMTYVERDLSSIGSRLTLGESNTSGELFDTFAFLGAQLASDDRMLPNSRQGYAPVVRGIADTQARVTIRQGSAVIDDRSVPPGPFVIDDLLPTGYGSALEVTVAEADGRKRHFSVAYDSVPMLLRPGMARYTATAGRLSGYRLNTKPAFFQGTLQYGLSNTLTAYGGVQAAARYQAVLGGIALGTPLGAFSLDLSAARTHLASGTRAGTSARLSFSKAIESTGSSVSLATYRYSSSGYRSLSDAQLAIGAPYRNGMRAEEDVRAKSRTSVMLNQSLGRLGGNLFVSAYSQNYWNTGRTDLQFQAGYSNQYRGISYSVTANRTRTAHGDLEHQFMLSASLPLGGQPRAPQLSMNLNGGSGHGMGGQATLSGSLGANGQLSYNATASRDASGDTSGSLSTQYRGTLASLNASYGQGNGYQAASVGVAGMAVAHAQGVSLSPDAGDTLAIVVAPGAAGASINGSPTQRIDSRVYGVVTSLTPYRPNDIVLDPRGTSDDVELRVTSQSVVPRAGAVVMLRYPTVVGHPMLLEARLDDGEPVPFGATATDSDGREVGIVGQRGRLHARLPDAPHGPHGPHGPHAESLLTLSWGDGAYASCRVAVRLGDDGASATQATPARRVSCHPPPATATASSPSVALTR